MVKLPHARIRSFVAAAVVLSAAGVVAAQPVQPAEEAAPSAAREKAAAILKGIDQEQEEGAAPAAPAQEESASGATDAAYEEALRASYKRDIWSYDYKQRIYEWQFVASKVVFFVVLFLVLSGIYFSWLQFHRAEREAAISRAKSRERREATGEDAEPEEVSLQSDVVHQLEASASGIKVSTPVLGVVILAISLAFFYLYLQTVYPIK